MTKEKEARSKYNIEQRQHTNTLGQVFLHDKNIVEKIIQFSRPVNAKKIVEIGCGKGILTMALNKLKKPVLVIEIDQRWLNHTKSLGLEHVEYILEDALKFDFNACPKNTAVVANIPYKITTPLIEQFTEYKDVFSEITIMLQREVADRLLASVGTKQYGVLSIFANYHFDIIKGFPVSRTCFNPVPNVDSFILKLRPKKSVLQKNAELLFFTMVRTLFWGRRKKIINCLKNSPYIHWSGYDIGQRISKNVRDNLFSLRGESLSLDHHLKMFEYIKPYIKLK